MKNYYIILLLLISLLFACSNLPENEYARDGNPPLTPELNERVVSTLGVEIDQVAFESFLKARMIDHNIPGLSLAITYKGETVYTAMKGMADVSGLRPVTNDTIFEAASLSKPMFGFMSMLFVEDGLLDLDVPLYTYLPFPDIAQDERYKSITARMVLSHTTGLPNWRRDEPEGKLTLSFNPGANFNYSGEAYQYLALVLAHLAQTDVNGLEAIFQERIAKPIGMTQTQFLPDTDMLDRRATPYRNGAPLPPTVNIKDIFGAAYGIHTQAPDFIRWATALLSKDILSDENYEKFFRGQNVLLSSQDPGRDIGLVDWSLGFSLYELPIGELYIHGGNNPGFSSVIVLNRKTNWGMTIFANSDQATPFMLQVVNYLMR